MILSKLLCPIDFSPGSRHAMRAAIRLANEHDAALVLAHVWCVPAIAYGSDYAQIADLAQAVEAEARDALDRAVREAIALGAKRVAPQLLTGSPRHELVKLLERDPELGLVVMGTHGRTGLARILLGSVAEGVVRHAPCSVLAVRASAEDRPFARILCPTDFSDGAQEAVDLAAQLAPPGSAAITLLHVIDPPAVYSRDQRLLAIVRDLDRFAATHLDRWAAALAARTPVQVGTRCRVGHPGAEILKFLDEEQAFDLVALGSHGRIGLERVLLGSVAEKIVRHAPCSVLVARRRADPR